MSDAVNHLNNVVKKMLLKKLLAIFFSSTGLIVILIALIMIMVLGLVANQNKFPISIDGPSTINVTPAVEAYREVVDKECTKTEIPNCTNVILAIIMQETGGNHLDVMQASESLGLPPNSIQDPAYSIEVGVNNFATTYALAKKAEQNILETALQGYNYGSGFINWAIEQDGGWTYENAIEFAKIHSDGVQRENGTWKYGDQNYIDHITRYMAANDGSIEEGTPSTGGNTVIEKAITAGSKYIGNSTYVFGGGRNNLDILKGYFDCSSFVYYAYNQAGLQLGDLSSATTDTLLTKGTRVNYSSIKRGDLVFFDTYKTNGHVGIYLGNGEFLGAQSNNGVSIVKMSNPYWKSVFNGVVVRVTK